MNRAFITGITGQDGSYLAEFLLHKGYEVHGLIRRSSSFNTDRIDHVYKDPHEQTNLHLHFGDLSDAVSLTNLLYQIEPNEIYNLGAMSHVKVSFDIPTYTGDVDALGTTRLLEAIRRSGIKTKFYQASSSEMFGEAKAPQNETTMFLPRSPYACAKLYSYWMTVNYREAYDMFACNGILFNHESPRRGMTFVTRKITTGIANIIHNKQDCIYLGNTSAKRDWGFAPEYVEMMWLMLQQEKPDDFVIGTGVSHSVEEFVKECLDYIHVYRPLTYNSIIRIDGKYFRPTEVDFLQADIRKAKKKLGWEPKVTFKELIAIMMDADMFEEGLLPIGSGEKILKHKFPYLKRP